MTWIRSHFPRLFIWLWILFDQSPDARFIRSVWKAGVVRRWSALRRGLTLGAAIFAVRDIIVTNKLVRGGNLNLGSIAAPANGGAFTQANGQQFTVRRSSKFFLLVYNSKAGAIIVTIKAGVYPPATMQGLGDLALTIPTTVFFALLGPFEGARHQQADGSIWVDTDAGATGSMWAFETPA